MTDREDKSEVTVTPGYAVFQLAKALITSEQHDDPATRARALNRIEKWETVLQSILSGSVAYGSRTPVAQVPAWATLEVATGGFATGDLLAGGPLKDHEIKLLETLPVSLPDGERSSLNAYFLTEDGLADLVKRLETNYYDVEVPEEGALLVVAWLVRNGYSEAARVLLEEISPYFSNLRFYPVPLDHSRTVGPHVHLQDVGATIKDLKAIRPNLRVLAQKEASDIWAAYYDSIVTLFLETVDNDWPCQRYPDGWRERATELHGRYRALRKAHSLCGKPERVNGHFAQLREFLDRCATNPESLTGKEVGRIRLILARYRAKRGTPNSPEWLESRSREAAYVAGPTFHEIVKVVVPRLEQHSKDAGLDDVKHLQSPVSESEATNSGIPVDTEVPLSIQRKVERCLNDTIDVLIERELITSGETLAKVLPQMISGIRAAGIRDPQLRQLYSAIYRAFRRRRSLLLLNLEKQVQLEELPWVAAIERFRSEDLTTTDLSRQALEEVVVLTLQSFPHAILPNKLLQELRALVKSAELEIPLVDELAADIFMGQFSGKFEAAAKVAGDLLRRSLYERYYNADFDELRKRKQIKLTLRRWWSPPTPRVDKFAELCAKRAGVAIGLWDPASNGMIIEQQQILTTQNLAALFSTLNLTESLRDQLGDMAKHCFTWVCNRQQVKIDGWHAGLTMLKNTAYAWRQMIFYLSLLSSDQVSDFLSWAETFYQDQSPEFQERFRPALKGLQFVIAGGTFEQASANTSEVRRFLGWSKTPHWLMPPKSYSHPQIAPISQKEF